jgi:hypothetical protein
MLVCDCVVIARCTGWLDQGPVKMRPELISGGSIAKSIAEQLLS